MRKFSELIAELENDPAMKDGLVEARKWVARQFYEPGSEQYERLMGGEGPAQETPADPPRPGCEEWWHLKQYGYAPGDYIITCFDCKQKVWDCDKRASICRPCAEKRHAAKTSPAPAERTVWTKTSDSDPYCIHCGKTWDMHICDGRSSCPTSNRRA